MYNHEEISKNDGVIVYIKNIYSHSNRIIHFDVCKVLEIKVYIDKDKHVLVTSIYRLPKTDIDSFLIGLEECLEQTKII